MKISELKAKSKEELKSLLEEKRVHVENMRFQLHQKKVKNVWVLGEERKDIARILTVLNSQNK